MKLKKLPIALILISLLWTTVFFAWNIYNQKNCYDAKCRIPKFLSKLKQSEIYENNKNRFRALYSNQTEKVRLDVQTNINHSRAQELFKSRQASLESLFEDRPATYPGTISRQTGCQQKYKPLIENINQNNIDIIVAKDIMFTNRFTVGACVDDLLPNKGFITWYWCPSIKTFYQVEYLQPKTNNEEKIFLSAISCSD